MWRVALLLHAAVCSAVPQDGVAETAALQKAVHRGDAAEVSRLLQHSPQQVLREKQQSALMVAAHAGSCRIAQLLLAAGGHEVNLVQDTSPQGGHATALTLALTGLESRLTQPPFDASRWEPHLCTVRHLLRYGADPLLGHDGRHRGPLMIAASLRHAGLLAPLTRALLQADALPWQTRVAQLFMPVQRGPFESRSPVHALADLTSAYTRVCTVLFHAWNRAAEEGVDTATGMEGVLQMLRASKVHLTGTEWLTELAEGSRACNTTVVRQAVRQAAVANLGKVAAAVKAAGGKQQQQHHEGGGDALRSLAEGVMRAAAADRDAGMHAALRGFVRDTLGLGCEGYPRASCAPYTGGDGSDAACAAEEEGEEEVASVASVEAADLSNEAFLRDYFNPRIPVLIRGGARGWGCASLTLQSFAEGYGRHSVSVGAIPYPEQYGLPPPQRLTVAEYLGNASLGERGLYAFDNRLHAELGATLGGLYALNPALPPKHNPPQFSVGHRGTGSPPHLHQDAINGICFGRKLWHLWQPQRSFLSVTPAARYFAAGWEGTRPLVVEQDAGDLLYVPHGWGHAVLNLDAVNVAVAVEYHRSL